MAAGAYNVTSTIGQPAAGATQSGGGYSLSGGVWDGSDPVIPPRGDQRVYLPTVLRSR